MNITEHEVVTYERVTCCVCLVKYFMPGPLKTSRLDDGRSFWCPNGHEQSYTDSREKRLKDAELKLAAMRNQLASEQDQRAAAQERIEKLTRRVKAGTCPFCKRTFNSLARHMESKHKGVACKS